MLPHLVFIYIFPMISDIEHLLMYLLVILCLLWENIFSGPYAHF